jgi:hypothetical protein
MNCNQCQELISDYIDGALEAGEEINIERHLRDCAACRALRDDLIQIVHFSRRLPLRAPSNQLWPRIASQIEQRPGSKLAAQLRKFKQRRFSFSAPQLAAGFAAIALLWSATIKISQSAAEPAAPTLRKSPSEAALMDEHIAQMENRIRQLSALIEERKAYWNPELRTAFDRCMLQIDRTLIECQSMVRKNPSDAVYQELMLNVYSEKARLLEEFSGF